LAGPSASAQLGCGDGIIYPLTHRVEPQASRVGFRLLDGAITITTASSEISCQVAALFPSYAAEE
jgi:hypothetical protein